MLNENARGSPSNRLTGLRNTTRSRSGRLVPMPEGWAPVPCWPRSPFVFFSREPASAPPWPSSRFGAVSSCPLPSRSRMAMDRPAWVVSVMARSWTTRIFPSAILLSTICGKHRLFWRPYFVGAGTHKDQKRRFQTALPPCSQSGVDRPEASAYISAQQVQSIRQEPAGRRSGAALPFCQKAFYVKHGSNRGFGGRSGTGGNADRAASDAKRD
jgi:hypothetical protein